MGRISLVCITKNDIESIHAVEKRAQGFQKFDILKAIGTIQSLMKREENDEVLAIYNSGNFVLSSV